MTDSSQDDDEKMEYLKANLMQHQPLSSRPPSNRQFRTKGFGLDDDDSSNLFMSEPSVSEADDSSGNHMRFLSPLGSFTEDEDDDDIHGHDYLPPPPPPPARLLTPVAPSSPGNTSLSSWESPHLNRQRRIHLHFSPGGDSQSHKADESVQSNPQHNHYQRVASPYHTSSHPSLHIPADPYLASALIPPSSGPSGAKTPDRSYIHSSNSASPTSEDQQQVLQTFLDDLRVNSDGQVHEVTGTNNSVGSSTLAGVPNAATINFDGILRSQPKLVPRKPPQQHSRISSIDTAAIDNTSGSGGEGGSNNKNNGPIPKNSSSKRNAAADESVVMILSDDSGDEIKQFTEGSSHTPLDWEETVSVSAEEEKITERRASRTLRNVRSFSGGGGRGGVNNGGGGGRGNNGNGRGHRRQRSGDAAAATLSTGSKEWKGMELHRIPLPPVPGGHDDDEEDDDEDVKDVKPMNGSNRNNKPRQSEGTSSEKNKSGAPSLGPRPSSMKQEINQYSQFALGTGGKEELHAQRRLAGNRNHRRQAYRGRRPVGMIPDSEDSSSSMASWDPPPQQGRRTASLPASAFSGYLASPDWSMPENRQHTRKGSHPIPWSPQSSHHSGATTSSLGMNEFNYDPSAPIQWGSLPKTSMALSNAALLRSNSLEFGPGSERPPAPANDTSAWAHHSTGSMDTSFSWLSGDNNAYFQTSEMSPLIGPRARSGVQTYGGQPKQSKQGSPPIHPYEFEQERRVRNRLGVNLGPLLNEGKKAFDASPFSKIKKKFTKADRQRFLPSSNFDDEDDNHPSFVCPVCKTRQREFFTVTNAPRQFESASGYIAFYFGIYVIAALYIFGLQEGWGKLDCIYFAVITLTTAGLGDFVPTSDGAKVVCSIFIYFGVACIGLLLGSYIAGMLDESSRRAARANRIKSCPNCVRIENIRDAAERRQKQMRRQKKLERRNTNTSSTTGGADPLGHDSKRMKRQYARQSFNKDQIHDLINSERPNGNPHNERNMDQFKKSNSGELAPNSRNPPRSPVLVVETVPEESPSSYSVPLIQTSRYVPGSPSTVRILKRQSHSRHSSMDLGGGIAVLNVPTSRRKYSADLGVPPTIQETPTNQSGATNPPPPPPQQWQIGENGINGDEDSEYDDSSSTSSVLSSDSSSSASMDLEEQYNTVKNARYVFLTLREALINSLVIIGTGCFGFYFIEGFSFVDSWYFTTVLLTTVGYGDLVPYTKGGKLFATVYILVAGTILLNNMSMISMIPLELRRRRTEKAVLTQFGNSLDDSALRELATGPLIRKLNLATNHALDECTREMFCLAMLVRLGKVTEEDIKLTFAAFKKLDVNDENVLNSRAIIAGMIQKRREAASLASAMNHSSSRSQASSYGFTPWGSGVATNIFVPSDAPTNELSSLGVGAFDSATPEGTSGSTITPRSDLHSPHDWRVSGT